MPPSRPRIEDSRPESSSLTSKTHDKHSILGPTSHSSVQKSTSSRSSRPGQNGTSSTTALSASASASKFAGGGHSNAPVLAGTSEDKEQPKIDWPSLPPQVLHRYRLTYLPVPNPSNTNHTASSSNPSLPPSHFLPHASAYLGRGIGLQSPSSAYHSRKRKAFLLQQQEKHSKKSTRQNGGSATANGSSSSASQEKGMAATSNAVGSGRIGRDELAMAVRKHFNGMGVNEGEVVARFAYLVNGNKSGGGGGGAGAAGGVEREFRLRFRP